MHSLRNRRWRVCDGSYNRNKETKQNKKHDRKRFEQKNKNKNRHVKKLSGELLSVLPGSREFRFNSFLFFRLRCSFDRRTKNSQIAAIFFFFVFGLVQHKTYRLDLRTEIC